MVLKMSNNVKTFCCKTEDDTKYLAEQFAKIAKKGDIFALYGTLGVGKSTFSRYFIKSICDVNDVPSPTFTLVQMYESNSFEIYHYDMYRLKNAEELFVLGVEDSFYSGVNLVEWPEKIQRFLPKDIWKITISTKENYRYFEIETISNDKINRLAEIQFD